jgi:hypothetical protein
MPATAAAQQMSTAAMATETDDDFSIVIRFMQELAGISDQAESTRVRDSPPHN